MKLENLAQTFNDGALIFLSLEDFNEVQREIEELRKRFTAYNKPHTGPHYVININYGGKPFTIVQIGRFKDYNTYLSI